MVESNSWPAARATTKRPVDYSEDVEESHRLHDGQLDSHQERRRDNEIEETPDIQDEDEEDEGDDTVNSLSPSVGRDTLYQWTTERSSWRSRGKNGASRPGASYYSIQSIQFVMISVTTSLVASLFH